MINDLDPEPAAETLAAIQNLGGPAVALAGDVTEADFGRRFVATATEAYGGIDILVNNAGYTWDGVIQKMSDSQWQITASRRLSNKVGIKMSPCVPPWVDWNGSPK